ncbi:MAG: short-chain dehydrogenase/reductase [Betaproteobacteria bacterium]
MDLKLKGRKALITGGSKGIGFSIAQVLVAEGCSVVLIARSEADLAEAKKRLGNATTHAMDLSERGKPQQLAAQHPDVDILVNNAGSTPRGTILDVDEDRFRAAFDLKVFGYINMCREFYRLMKARRRGVIINILGNGGEAPDAGYIAGAACNASLMAFTRALGGQSDRDGVRVVGVNPGPVATERLVGLMKTEAKRKFGDESRWQELSSGFPFGRAATVEEVANTVALLASDLSSYTTGTVVTIDGGMVNHGSLI